MFTSPLEAFWSHFDLVATFLVFLSNTVAGLCFFYSLQSWYRDASPLFRICLTCVIIGLGSRGLALLKGAEIPIGPPELLISPGLAGMALLAASGRIFNRRKRKAIGAS